MKKIVVLTFSLLFIIFYASQSAPEAAQHQFPGLEQQESFFKTVTPQEAKNLIESRSDLLLVDVRGEDELSEGYIEGSVMMPLWSIIKGSRRPPKDRPILLICAVGGRSLALGQLMSRNGWDEVYNLKGGISAWKEAHLPLKY
jgi:rhodanese-related sulfurtransferase